MSACTIALVIALFAFAAVIGLSLAKAAKESTAHEENHED